MAHPILVELFTSEGCSSCPPADALLEKMDGSRPSPGVQLIVLSEHVDYWDHDGWKDPNSSPVFTERQESYVHALKLQTPYTPQMIVDGSAVLQVDDPQQISKIFRDEAAAPKAPLRIDEVTFAADSDAGSPSVVKLRVQVDGNSDQRNADVYVAIALDRVQSQVLRGENGGRRLTHVAVVQQLTKIGKLQKGNNFDQTIQLKLKPGTDPKHVRIVAFAQEAGPGRLVGVVQWKPGE